MGKTHGPPRALRMAGLTAFWLLFAYLFSLGTGYPWDFETYYYAASAALRGLDPYDTENLVALAKRPVGMPFVYPPATVALFAPFTLLPVHTADTVWLVLKTVLLMLLLRIWLRRFLAGTDPIVLSLVVALGFNTAALWDLKIGNVAILEALLLWAALAFYADGRRTAFAVLTVLASVFKLLPIVFLVLLVVPSENGRRHPRLALAALALHAAIVLIPVFFGPAWARGYFSHVPVAAPSGIVNPCALGVFDTLLGTGSPEPGTAPAARMNTALVLWMAYAAALAWFSGPAIRRASAERDHRTLALAGVFLFELLSPRPMIYSYVMLIPPTLAFGPPLLKRVGGLPALVALLIAPAVGRRLGYVPRTLFWDNYPFFLALGIWLLYAWSVRRGVAPSAARARAGTGRARGMGGAGRRRSRATAPVSPSRPR